MAALWVMAVLVVTFALAPAAMAQTRFLTIATGGTAGTYYPLGGAMAEIFNQNVPGVEVSVQATGASVANINLLAQGQVDLALIQNDRLLRRPGPGDVPKSSQQSAGHRQLVP